MAEEDRKTSEKIRGIGEDIEIELVDCNDKIETEEELDMESLMWKFCRIERESDFMKETDFREGKKPGD